MGQRKKISLIILAVVLLAGIGCGLAAGLILAVGLDLPQIQQLEDFEPGAATRIMSRDGVVLAELFLEKRFPLPLDDIPPALRQAVIAVEDRRFHQHPGLDVIRNFGALWANLRAGSMVEGGSTITQQLAKNLFLTPEKTLIRKLKEAFLALQIERRYTKDEILRLYLNQVYFGSGAYGIGAAADIYFKKPVKDLMPGELSLLAGLIKSPNQYSPFDHPEKAISRRAIVLKAMVREGYLTPEQAAEAGASILNLTERSPSRLAPYFVQFVKSTLLELYGENAVYKGGLTVETTLDWATQSAAEQALAAGLTQFERRLEAGGRLKAGQVEGELQTAMVALRVGTGGIIAWVGGADFKKNPADHILKAPRPIGSAITPIIYSVAIENGLTQADRVWDGPVSYRRLEDSQTWRPENANRRFEGEITLRRAVETSARIPTVKTLSRVGVDQTISTARALGLVSPLPRDLTLATGGFEVGLLEMTAAYSIMASRGLWFEPHAITEIKDRSGRTIYRAAPKRQPALSPETAYIVTDMLKGSLAARQARPTALLDRPAAGTGGTTMDFTDASFFGYTTDVAAGVWVGWDPPRSLGRGWTASRTAWPIWLEFMKRAATGPVRDFDKPAGVILAPMDKFSGTSARPGDPGFVPAAFRTGTAPSAPTVKTGR